MGQPDDRHKGVKQASLQAQSLNAAAGRGTEGGNGLQLPPADSLTLQWLWKYVPVKYWLSILFLLGTFFIAGLYAGQVVWISDLAGIKRPNPISIQSVPEPKLERAIPTEVPNSVNQRSTGDKSQNIVTKGNVDIRFEDEKKAK
jgi:hypothetical protein